MAHGTFEVDRWSFSGTVPQRAARIDIETDADTTYSVSCDQTHWTLALNRGDLPAAVVIQATATDGTVIVREACLLADHKRRQPTGRRWLRRRANRGWTTYGPGSR
jgi:hypothetical protein